LQILQHTATQHYNNNLKKEKKRKEKTIDRAWWYMPLIPACWRLTRKIVSS
jgi:hypothetical protein